MLKKLMLVVASLWVVLQSSDLFGHSFSNTIEHVKKSVCIVTFQPGTVVIDSKGDKILENPFEDFLKKKNQLEGSGLGSCFIIEVENKKYIITNDHVANSSANSILYIVFYNDLKEYKAKLVGTDKVSDIAVLEMEDAQGKIKLETVPPLELGNSDLSRQGDQVFAIGHPIGQQWTVTQGIVSAIKKRTSNTWQEVIQTDVSINQGNSGGPLFNSNGEVVGINSFIISPTRSGGNVGINFSVTSNSAKYIINTLIKEGNVARGRLGVAFSVDVKRGVIIIKDIIKDSPMDKSDFKVNDILEKINGIEIKTLADVGVAMDYVKPKQEVEVQVLRGDINILTTIVTDEVKF